MIFATDKRINKEVERRLQEERLREEMWRRQDAQEKRINDLEWRVSLLEDKSRTPAPTTNPEVCCGDQ